MLAVPKASAQIGTTNEANTRIMNSLKLLKFRVVNSGCRAYRRKTNSRQPASGNSTIAVLADHSSRRNDSHTSVIQARHRLHRRPCCK